MSHRIPGQEGAYDEIRDDNVSKAGGLNKALQDAISLKCDTIQMFAGSPRSLRNL